MDEIIDSDAKVLSNFLRQRVTEHLQLVKTISVDSMRSFLESVQAVLPTDIIRQICANLAKNKSSGSGEIVGFCLADGKTLACTTCSIADESIYVLALINGPADLSCLALRNAVEAWTLKAEIQLSQAALDESAMQLAQSFEEQNWLRGFAKNTSSLTGLSNPNEIANGILQPLGYLLRAQDVFLIIDPVESEKSGLVSTKYGDSPFSTRSIRAYLDTFGFQAGSSPLVRNNLP